MSLIPSPQSLTTAALLLERGDVVAMPTETVYGLAARIDREGGLKRIFSVKERPFFDPLIVHVDSVAMARLCTREWPQTADVLASAFWPGPLTMVLPKSSLISDLITSGLEGVGLRSPDHPVARQLIEMSGVPLAAPSANRFGHTSPSTWEHVSDEFGETVYILKADAGRVGIESTVLKVDGDVLTLLRPGMVSRGQIDAALAQAGIDVTWQEAAARGEAPGQMKHHYMPRIPLVLVPVVMTEDEILERVNARRDEMPDQLEGVDLRLERPEGVYRNLRELRLPDDAELAARRLYADLRTLAESGTELLYFRRKDVQTGEHWAAVLERLTKAASLSLL